jgi:hypothetical protein
MQPNFTVMKQELAVFEGHEIRQLVTNCYQLKTGNLRTGQPVTNCNRLKFSPNQRNPSFRHEE